MIRDVESQLLTLQWQGEIQTVNVIEHGPGWINAYVVAENVDPALYALASLRSIVTAGLLPLFAESNSEKMLFTHNNVTILSNASFGISEAGYNAGNYLIGLRFSRYLLEH